MKPSRWLCLLAVFAGEFVGAGAVAQTSFGTLTGQPLFPGAVAQQPPGFMNGPIGRTSTASGKTVSDGAMLANGSVAESVFFEARTYATGTFPAYVAAGDLNGDGKVDLVTANATGDSISVFLNNGDGTFQPHVDYGVGLVPYSVVLADFNGDGKLDAAVANLCGTDSSCQSPGTISILLGNGNGTFQPQVSYEAGNDPFSVGVGDFNGDGKLDLGVTEQNCISYPCALGSVSIFLGNGDGSFQTRVDYAVPRYETGSISLADFNGDRKLDMAVVSICGNDATCQNGNPGSVSIFLGNGDGTFQPPEQYPTPAYPESLAVGDFNGDGEPDFATAGQFTRSVMSVFLGKGDGTFQPFVNYPAINIPYQIVSGDFNGDGKTDVAEAGEGGVGIHLGNGDGTFQPVVGYVSGFDGSLAAADLNGDGILDLATANTYDGVVSTLLGAVNGAFQSSPTYKIGKYAGPSAAAVGTFNTDQVVDFAVADAGNGAGDMGAVSVFIGGGDGAFKPAVSYAAGPNPWSLAVGDFNGDGKSDIVVGDNNYENPLDASMSVLLGNGDGTFQTPIEFSPDGYYPDALLGADFNGDGKLDLAVSNQQAAAPNYAGNLLVFLGNGNGTFQSPITVLNDNHSFQMVAADFNRDGKLDLAATIGQGISIFLGNGNGTFQSAVNYTVGWNQAGVVAGDFNHDGIVDLATTGMQNGSQSDQGEVSVFLGNGDGSFQAPTSYPSGFYADWLVLADFNGDGYADIAITTGNGTGSNTIALLLGNGDGTFQAPVNYIAGYGMGGILAADLNGDNSVDILFTDYSYGENVGVLLNQRGTQMETRSSQNPSTSGEVVTFTTVVSASVKGVSAVPKGTVTFTDQKTVLGVVRMSNGRASYTTSSLSVGEHKIGATYSGDENFNRNEGAPVIQRVIQ